MAPYVHAGGSYHCRRGIHLLVKDRLPVGLARYFAIESVNQEYLQPEFWGYTAITGNT